MKYTIKQNHYKSADLIIFICSVIIGICEVLYPTDIQIDHIAILKIVFSILFHYFLLSVLFNGIEKIIERNRGMVCEKTIKESRIFIALSIIYVLPLIVFYPGINGWDTEYQLVDLFDGIQEIHRDSWGTISVSYILSDHMCLFDTFLFGSFIELGRLVGNVNHGVFLYCLPQAVFFAFVCTKIIKMLIQWGTSRNGIVISFLFFALSPFIWMYSINMLKDSINAVLFVLYFLFYVQIIRKEKTIGWKLFFLTLAVCLTKKTGIIIVVPSNIILALYLRKELSRKAFFLSLCIGLSPILIISIILQKVIYPLCMIYQDGFPETVASLFQQIGRIVKYYGDSLSVNEIQKIDTVLEYNSIGNLYNYNCVDYVKDTFRIQSSLKDFVQFVTVWFVQLIKHPVEYIHSLIGTNGGFFSATHNINIYTNWNDWGNLGVIHSEWSADVRIAFAKLYEHICNGMITGIPFKTFVYTWIIPCFAIWKSVKTRSKELLIILLPTIFSIVTFFLSPVVNSRYALHIILISPLLVLVSEHVFQRPKGIETENV